MTETDYLIVGAGAAGMAIADALLTHDSGAHITLVDRRHAPGGHWLDAYPFVKLHQPSVFYGVDSMPMDPADDEPDPAEPGAYPRANADALRAYYARVLARRLLPSGRVRFLGCTDHQRADGDAHTLHNRLSGHTFTLRARRKWIDTTWLEGQVPATTPPPFELAGGARCVPVGDLARPHETPDRYVLVGAGKTALDAAVWLLDQGVPPERIQWIKPREGWWINRRHHQPHAGQPDFLDGVSRQIEAMARAATVDEVFDRLEADGFFLRVDRGVRPTQCSGAIASEAEIAQLRRITDVVRLGHVRRIGAERIELDHGSVPTSPRTLHVHCAARGLARPPLRPVFEPQRITVQPLFWSFACFPFALIGAVEALVPTDEERNRLCPPVPYWTTPRDYVAAFGAGLASERARAAHPALAAWARGTRLSPLSGLGPHRQHPTAVQAFERIRAWGAQAGQNLPVLLARPAA